MNSTVPEHVDLNFSKMKEAWYSDIELLKYPFILDAWVGSNDEIQYGLMHGRETTEQVLKVMAAKGYRSSIVEQLLKELE